MAFPPAPPHRQRQRRPTTRRDLPPLLALPLLPRQRRLPETLRLRPAKRPGRDPPRHIRVPTLRRGDHPQPPLRPRLQRLRRLQHLPADSYGHHWRQAGVAGQAEGRGQIEDQARANPNLRIGERPGASSFRRLRNPPAEPAGPAAVRQSKEGLPAELARLGVRGEEGRAPLRVPETGNDGPENLRGPRDLRGGPVHEGERAGAAEPSLLVERAADGSTRRDEQAVRREGLRPHDSRTVRDPHFPALRFIRGYRCFHNGSSKG